MTDAELWADYYETLARLQNPYPAPDTAPTRGEASRANRFAASHAQQVAVELRTRGYQV